MAAMRESLKEIGVVPRDVFALSLISKGSCPTDLGERLGLSSAGVRKLVEQLVDARYVWRGRGRMQQLRLAPRGAALLEEVQEAMVKRIS